MARVNISVRDFSDEYGRVTFELAEELGTATVSDIDTNKLTPLSSAVAGVSLGAVARESYTMLEGGNDQRPASQFAQRELGLRIFYHGTTSGEKRNITIPAPDLAALSFPAGGDLADITAAPLSTLVAEIEANVVINGSEAVVVDRAVVVGRNS